MSYKPILKSPQPWLTRKQALKRSQDDEKNHWNWRCDCTKKDSWKIKDTCEMCELTPNVSLKFWHNGASAHVGYICKKCFNSKLVRKVNILSLKGYMIYFGPALDRKN